MKTYLFLFLKLCSIALIVQANDSNINKTSYDLNISVKGNIISETNEPLRTSSTLSSVISSDGVPSIVIIDQNGNEISVIQFDDNSNRNDHPNSVFYFYTNAVWLNDSNFSRKIIYNFKDNLIDSFHINDPKEKLLNTLSITSNTFDTNGVLHQVNNSISTNSITLEGNYYVPSAVLEFFYLKTKNISTKQEEKIYD
ncbi:MAG: hypothetical protein ACRDDH_19425 [Cetobacterium sp.]|uniref:hypothetical protein n=1 Tax=Cetobacterium sp. TaxID=2071632 RepID=UPI003EE6F1FE